MEAFVLTSGRPCPTGRGCGDHRGGMGGGKGPLHSLDRGWQHSGLGLQWEVARFQEVRRLKLKELREARGLTRYRVAKDAGLDWGQLVEVEEGRSGMRIDNAVRVADVLGVSLDELAGREWPKAS